MRVAESGTTCFTEFVVEIIKHARKITIDHPGHDCYWTEFQKGHPNSGVAISTCSGMVGSHSCKTG